MQKTVAATARTALRNEYRKGINQGRERKSGCMSCHRSAMPYLRVREGYCWFGLGSLVNCRHLLVVSRGQIRPFCILFRNSSVPWLEKKFFRQHRIRHIKMLSFFRDAAPVCWRNRDSKQVRRGVFRDTGYKTRRHNTLVLSGVGFRNRFTKEVV